MHKNTEFWIMPTDEHWRWQVVNDRNEVTLQGVAETMQEACEAARYAAWKANTDPVVPL